MRCHEDQDSALSTRGVLGGLLIKSYQLSEIESMLEAHNQVGLLCIPLIPNPDEPEFRNCELRNSLIPKGAGLQVFLAQLSYMFLILTGYQLLITCSQEWRNYPSSYLTETNGYSSCHSLNFMGNCKVHKAKNSILLSPPR
jgi:hypothetical protein